MRADSSVVTQTVIRDSKARHDRARLRIMGAALFMALCLSIPVLAAADDAAGCPSGAASSACTAGLSDFSQLPHGERAEAKPRAGRLDDYAPNPQARPTQPSMEGALAAMPSRFVRVMRWVASAMISMGLIMMFSRRWFAERIRKADEEGTIAARRMLEQPEPFRAPPPPASVPLRRIEWTPERIGALSDERYARLCAGYWETRGYIANVAAPDAAGAFLIGLHKSDRRTVVGLVCFLPRDDGRSGLDTVRGLRAAAERGEAGVTVLMTRSVLSDAASSRAASAGLQVMDQAALLKQLGALSQDQQETLFAELDAYTPSIADTTVESSPP